MRRLIGRAFIALGGPQPRLVCMVFGAGAWVGGLLLTLDSAFASIAARHFFANRFKIGLRFLAWSVQYGWLRRQVAHDPLFVCSLFLSLGEMERLARQVQKSRHRVSAWLSTTDLVCLYGNLAQAALLRGDRALYLQWHELHAREATEAVSLVGHLHLNQTRLAEEIGQQAAVVAAQDADAALRDFNDICSRLGVGWFVVSGTFLGVVREQDWLAHDYDIDVGIMADEFRENELIEALTQGGTYALIKFDRQVRFTGPDGGVDLEDVPACIKVVHRTGVQLDIFIHHIEGDVCWHGSAINRWNNSRFELVPYSFRGHTVLGPRDSDRYLTENYGNWRVPVTSFHSTDGSGTPNLVLVRNLFIVGLCIKRMLSVDPATKQRLLSMLLDLGAITELNDGWKYNPNYCLISDSSQTRSY